MKLLVMTMVMAVVLAGSAYVLKQHTVAVKAELDMRAARDLVVKKKCINLYDCRDDREVRSLLASVRAADKDLRFSFTTMDTRREIAEFLVEADEGVMGPTLKPVGQ